MNKQGLAIDRQGIKNHQEDDGGEELVGRDREYRTWAVLLLIIAAGLWAQLLGAGVWAEVQSEDGSALILALQLLPLLMAVAAVWVHHRVVRLFVFPMSLVPGMALMAEAEWAAAGEPISLMVKGALFGLYLVVAAGRPVTKDLIALPRRPVGQVEGKIFEDRRFRRFMVWRVLASAVIFGVITYALFVDPEISAAMSTVETRDGRASHQAFVVVLMYFGWTIAIYMGTVLPVLNWEYQRYQPGVPRSLGRLLRRPGYLMLRITLWMAGLIVAIVGGLWVLSP